MGSRWIVKRNQKEQGPYTSVQLKKLADDGRLRRTDWVRKHNSEKYVRAEKVKRLFDDAPPAQLGANEKSAQQDVLMVAEVVEVIDDSPDEINDTGLDHDDGSHQDFDMDESEEYVDDDDFSYEEPEDEFDDYAAYEPPPPRPSRRPRRTRQASRRPPSRTKPRKKTKRASSDDDEDGPWSELFGGIATIAAGIGIFFAIGPEGVEISGYGIIVWIMMLLNKIGGRWAILVFFIFAGCLAIGDAIRKFRES